jgi:diguanylate cyclase (GGDEF)-like protein/putative nucleotidyltransferase with HDIG domain
VDNYVYISVFAMSGYLFLFLAFMAAKKTKIIRSFLYVLLSFLLWTAGSIFMRMMIWPGIKFWFQVSILGLLMLPFVFYFFVHSFIGIEDEKRLRIWFGVGIFNFILNLFTNIYIPAPEAVTIAGGTVQFVYHMKWTLIFLIICVSLTILDMIHLWRVHTKDDAVLSRQFTPIFVGSVILFAGQIATTFPIFKGFPIDIVSGIINAGFLFYALYKKRLFKLTLLVSRGVVYGLSIGLTVILFANLIVPMEAFLYRKLGEVFKYDVLMIAILFTSITLIISVIIRKFMDMLFTKDEIMHTESLKEFSVSVSKSLRVDEIMDHILDIIHKTIEVKKVYICVPDKNEKRFVIARSSSPLDSREIQLEMNNPAVEWLIQNEQCVLIREFQRNVYYKAMWEKEKRQLEKMEIECIAPLISEDKLVGIILLSQKPKGKSYTYDDLTMLDSINSIASIAIRNSRLYEKAYMEARTDELTGVLNRKYFYEKLQEECERCKSMPLALVIFNLDDFKLYNQLYGMREGDYALKEVARILTNCVGESGYVARYSGKEFAIILPGFDVLTAKRMAVEMSRQIANMHRRDSDYMMKMLTVSGGICVIPYSATTMKEIMENADMAVYTAKRKGKNQILVYEAGKIANSSQMQKDMDKKDVYSEYASTIYALTAAIDVKDHYTFNHSKNVAYYAVELAKEAGMNSDFVEIIREAGLLHDIGKIGIPEHILNKVGRLTEEEYEVMKSHVEHSIGIIRNLPSLDYVIPAVIGHHERYDGKGYPRGIKGEDIPLAARMLCVADSFDAMISKRSYKEPYTLGHTLAEMEKQAGLQFDGHLVTLFVRLVKTGRIEVQYDELSNVVS